MPGQFMVLHTLIVSTEHISTCLSDLHFQSHKYSTYDHVLEHFILICFSQTFLIFPRWRNTGIILGNPKSPFSASLGSTEGPMSSLLVEKVCFTILHGIYCIVRHLTIEERTMTIASNNGFRKG